MIGDRTDPHRFGEWDNMTSRERSGQCIDLLQDIERRLVDMQKALVRKERTKEQQYALANTDVILSMLRKVKEKLIGEYK